MTDNQSATLQAELRTAIIAAIHEYAIACTIYNANEFKFVTIATDQILATVSKHLPEKTDTSWQGKELSQPVNPIDAVIDVAGMYGEKCFMDGRNTAITEMEKTLGADHE